MSKCKSKYCPFESMSSNIASSLRTFSGQSEDIEHFLVKFKLVAELEKWGADKKVLMLKLACQDQALKFILTDPKAKEETEFEELEKLLIEKFKKKESFSHIQANFSNIKQKQGQSVKDLSEEITEIVNKYTKANESQDAILSDLNEKMKLTKFLEALRPDIKLEVKKTGPKNFKNAVATAINIEQALEENPPINTDFDLQINALLQQQVQSNQIIQNLTEKIENLQPTHQVNNVASTSRISSHQNFQNRERVQCHICFKGHRTTNCWYFPREQNVRGARQNFRYNRGRNNTNRRSNFRGMRSRSHPYSGQSNGNFNQNFRQNLN